MLGVFGTMFREGRLKRAAEAMLRERCGVRLGPKGLAQLDAECKEVLHHAGNGHDAASRLLSAMVAEPSIFGLDAGSRRKTALWAERLAKDAVLPETTKRARKAAERADSAAGFDWFTGSVQRGAS